MLELSVDAGLDACCGAIGNAFGLAIQARTAFIVGIARYIRTRSVYQLTIGTGGYNTCLVFIILTRGIEIPAFAALSFVRIA